MLEKRKGMCHKKADGVHSTTEKSTIQQIAACNFSDRSLIGHLVLALIKHCKGLKGDAIANYEFIH